MAVAATTPAPAVGTSAARAAMRAHLSDLFTPRPRRYWADFLLSVALGWLAFGVALRVPMTGPQYWLAMGVAGLALYRAVSFTHELAHLRSGELPGFRTAWTLLCGIPLLVPNFLYTGVHVAHHGQRTYGTTRDGEYLPFVASGPALIAQHLLGNLVMPLFAVLRFGVIGPVSFLHPRLRNWVESHLSAMSLRFPFTREAPVRTEERKLWLREELATSAFTVGVLTAVGAGWLPTRLLLQYGLAVFLIATLNSVRAIGATHRYRSDGKELDLAAQFADSVNVHGSRLDTLLLCPVGLRFHALHHAFPTLPYHALAEGHRRLTRALPPESSYHNTRILSVWHGWRQLLADCARHRRLARTAGNTSDRIGRST